MSAFELGSRYLSVPLKHALTTALDISKDVLARALKGHGGDGQSPQMASEVTWRRAPHLEQPGGRNSHAAVYGTSEGITPSTCGDVEWPPAGTIKRPLTCALKVGITSP